MIRVRFVSPHFPSKRTFSILSILPSNTAHAHAHAHANTNTTTSATHYSSLGGGRPIYSTSQSQSQSQLYLQPPSLSCNRNLDKPFSISFSTNSNSDKQHSKPSTSTSNSSTSLPKTPSDTKLLSNTSTSILTSIIPTKLLPYARLARMDKPIGTALLLWPCYWSTAIAASPGMMPDPTLLGLFTVGAFAMRGAGCTINDMWDRDYDKNVTRTKTRPLASGELTMTQATSFLALQLGAGLGVLLHLPHTDYCFWLCSASLPLVATYPLMKRYTNWPQLVLGLTFNWGAFVGWAATYGSLDLPVVLPLYVSGVCWTIVYDTLYAHQDKKDDAKLGLKSTALYFGDNSKPILHGFSALTLAGWTMTGYGLGYDTPIFYLGSLLGWSHLAWQVHTADLEDPDNLASRFRSNQQVGAIIFGSCILGNLTSSGFLS